MTKDLLTLLGIDSVGAALIWAHNPSFLKVVLGVGIMSLVAFLFLSKGQGRVSTYGANLCMAFVAALHYL